MKLIKRLASGSAAALALTMAVAASSAQAAIITVTVTGVAGNSGQPAIDTNDFFSNDQANLSGMAFTAQFVFNDAAPGAFNTIETDGPIVSTGLAGQNVLQSMSLSLGGASYDFSIFAGIITSSNIAFNVNGLALGDKIHTISMQFNYADFSVPFFTGDYHTDIDYDVASIPPIPGLTFNQSIKFNNGNTNSVDEDIPLIAQDITVSSVGAPAPFQVLGVPEPSAWAMMILGVAITGCALRRRTRPLAIAVAV